MARLTPSTHDTNTNTNTKYKGGQMKQVILSDLCKEVLNNLSQEIYIDSIAVSLFVES